MECVLALLVAGAMGVNVGWQPVAEESGGYEYVVQLEPETAELLASGQSVPIESCVPAEVAPVRKIRIVVGQGDMPRTDLVARGQDNWGADVPRSYTVHRPGDPPPSAWPIDRYDYQSNSPASQPAANWPTAAAPSMADGWTRTAARDSGVAPVAGQSARAASPASPVGSGWTSIGRNVAAPPLLNPPLVQPGIAAPTTASNPRFFSSGRSDDRYQTNPVDIRPPANPVDAGSDWATSWGTNSPNGQAPAARQSADLDLVPVQPSVTRQPVQPQAADRWTDPWPENASSSDWSWPTDHQPSITVPIASSTPPSNWPSTPQAPAAPQANGWPSSSPSGNWPTSAASGGWLAAPSVAAADGWGDPPRASQTSTSPTNAAWPANPDPRPPLASSGGQPVLEGPAGSTATLPIATNLAPSTLAQQQPWLPLLLVSLGLAGSFGANLFLGWSYMDARHRYRSLIRKTGRVFERVTGAAA